MRMAPEVGASKPASIIRHVVLPDPDGPSKVRELPLRDAEVQVPDHQRPAVIALVDVLEFDVGVVA